MLQQMRRFAGSWVASIFLGALAFSFAIWGIADIFTGGSDTSIASVGGEKISPEAYQQQYHNLLTGAQNRVGQQLTTEQAKRMGLPQDALNSLLADVALANVVKKLGLVTTDQQVATYVHAIPQFNGPLGTFDRATFLAELQRSGFTEQSFIQTIRDQSTRDQIAAAARNGMVLPEGYTHAILSYVNERRAVQYVDMPGSAIAAPPPPADATLSAYMAKHPDRYSTPEYRNVTFATIGPNDLINETKVTDAQLHQEYDARKDDPAYAYIVPDKRDVATITFPDEASAKAARAKIDAGTSFADIAKARGTAPTAFPAVQKADLGDRGATVFALPFNGVSQPLKNLSGWDLTQVTKISPGTNKTFDMVKADLQKDVEQKLAAAKAQDMANAYTDANSGGASLTQAAEKVGMKVVHVGAVDSQGLAPDGTHASVPANPEFLQQVFKADIGVEGDPFTTRDGTVFVLLVNGQTPPHLKALDAVRAPVTAAWQSEQQRKLLTDKAKALTAEANNSSDLSGIAKQLGVAVQASPALERPSAAQAAPTGFDTPLLLTIFAAPPGTVVYGPDAKGDGFVIAKITGVVHPPIPSFDPRYRQFETYMNARAGSDAADTFALAAKAQQGVTLNQKAISHAMGEGS